jgi:hypothetical protein
MGDIFLSGEKQSTKHPEPPSRLKIIKIFTSVFDLKLSLLVHEIYTSHANEVQNPELKDHLERLIDDIFCTVGEIYETKIRVAKKTRVQITEIKKSVDQLCRILDRCVQAERQLNQSKYFSSAIKSLALLVDDFVFQFDATCDLIWASKDLPFRPTNRDLKKRVLDAVIHYCDENKKEKYPPYFWLLKHLKLPDNMLSERTYGLWKKQMDKCVFHLALLPKKSAISSEVLFS